MKEKKNFFGMMFWILMLGIGILACASMPIIAVDVWGRFALSEGGDPGLLASIIFNFLGKNVLFFYIFPIASLPVLFWASHLAQKKD